MGARPRFQFHHAPADRRRLKNARSKSGCSRNHRQRERLRRRAHLREGDGKDRAVVGGGSGAAVHPWPLQAWRGGIEGGGGGGGGAAAAAAAEKERGMGRAGAEVYEGEFAGFGGVFWESVAFGWDLESTMSKTGVSGTQPATV